MIHYDNSNEAESYFFIRVWSTEYEYSEKETVWMNEWSENRRWNKERISENKWCILDHGRDEIGYIKIVEHFMRRKQTEAIRKVIKMNIE